MIEYNRNLFVCLGNVDRSVAGEIVFREGLASRGFKVGKLRDLDGFDFYVGSAGLLVSAPNIFNGSVQLTREMTQKADRIFSMDEMITQGLRRDYGVRMGQIVQLDIEDGRSLIIAEQAESLYAEFRRKLEKYLLNSKIL